MHEEGTALWLFFSSTACYKQTQKVWPNTRQQNTLAQVRGTLQNQPELQSYTASISVSYAAHLSQPILVSGYIPSGRSMQQQMEQVVLFLY